MHNRIVPVGKSSGLSKMLVRLSINQAIGQKKMQWLLRGKRSLEMTGRGQLRLGEKGSFPQLPTTCHGGELEKSYLPFRFFEACGVSRSRGTGERFS